MSSGERACGCPICSLASPPATAASARYREALRPETCALLQPEPERSRFLHGGFERPSSTRIRVPEARSTPPLTQRETARVHYTEARVRYAETAHWTTLAQYGQNSVQHKNIVAKLRVTLGNKATLPIPRVIQVILICVTGDVGTAAHILKHSYTLYTDDLVFFDISGDMVHNFRGAMKNPQDTLEAERMRLAVLNNDGSSFRTLAYDESASSEDWLSDYSSEDGLGVD